MAERAVSFLSAVLVAGAASGGPAAAMATPAARPAAAELAAAAAEGAASDPWSTFFVFVLATFIGLGVIGKVSRLLHTPLMSLTNAISAIAVVGSIIVAGGDYPLPIRVLGAVALFASMTNIVSGFLITNRMQKMFKQPGRGKQG
jgi:NAD(P) transhydrogenase subunit alpha